MQLIKMNLLYCSAGVTIEAMKKGLLLGCGAIGSLGKC